MILFIDLNIDTYTGLYCYSTTRTTATSNYQFVLTISCQAFIVSNIDLAGLRIVIQTNSGVICQHVRQLITYYVRELSLQCCLYTIILTLKIIECCYFPSIKIFISLVLILIKQPTYLFLELFKVRYHLTSECLPVSLHLLPSSLNCFPSFFDCIPLRIHFIHPLLYCMLKLVPLIINICSELVECCLHLSLKRLSISSLISHELIHCLICSVKELVH